MCTRYGKITVYNLRMCACAVEVEKMLTNTYDTMNSKYNYIIIRKMKGGGGATFSMSFLVNEAWNPIWTYSQNTTWFKRCKIETDFQFRLPNL